MCVLKETRGYWIPWSWIIGNCEAPDYDASSWTGARVTTEQALHHSLLLQHI